MAAIEPFRTMDAQALTRKARDVFENIKRDIPSQYRTELTTIVQELTERVDFVVRGKTPGKKTKYQSLEASALAQQARHVLSQVARRIPQARKEALQLVETLADRVEFAAIGAPARKPAARPKPRPKAVAGSRR